MEEFDEIEPAGFTIEFTPMEDGGCVVSGKFPESFSMIPNRLIRTVQVVVNNAGTVLELDSMCNSPFLRTHATYLVSDREGLFGRACPSCKSYFRTNSMKRKLICPYCSWKDENGAFTTENQKKFMYFCFKAGEEAMMKRVKTIVDLGDAAKALLNNKPAWVYTEENQQHTFSCKECKQYNINIVFNILGEFGNCPSCGKRNYALVFESKMQLLQRQFTEKDAGVKEPQRRSEE